MLFFYVLVNGVSWKIASKLVTNSEKHYKRFNYLFNLWSNDLIFVNLKEDKRNIYLQNNIIESLKIDSTDIINGNCNKKELAKSLKLNKQAIKATFIIDSNIVPICESFSIPTIHDSKEGLNLILSDENKKSNKVIYLSADKGYILSKQNRNIIRKTKNIIIVTPKREYKKKIYKTKNYKKKIKRIRHSKVMKDELKKRIYVEHFNSTIHRSYKRLDKIYDKSLNTFKSFMDLALAVIINRHI